MNFNIKIELDKVILIGENPKYNVSYIGSEFTTRFLLIKGIDDKIFHLRSDDNGTLYQELINSDYEVIDVEKRLKEKVKTIIQQELEKIYAENINKDFILDYSIEEKTDIDTGEIIPYKQYTMLDEAYWFGNDIRDDEYRTRYLNLGFQEIDKGIISVMNPNIKYDLINDKFINSDRDLLLAFYDNNEIKKIILYEKYKNGLGSELYKEIAKMNEFLKGKNSITVILKNGTIFKTDSRLRYILDIYPDGNIYISETYNQKIIKGKKFSSFQYKVSELDSLKYGRTELKINTENLMELSKKNTKEIEIEDTEEM